MTANELRRILSSFVNDPTELDFRAGRIVANVQNDLIDVLVKTDPQSGELIIEDGDTVFAPRDWLLRRVARIELLAERILATTTDTSAFVRSSGVYRAELASSEDDDEVPVGDVVVSLQSTLSRRIPATTSVVYLTSDAGEGKTTLINHLARQQATSCKNRNSNWLLVPIPLGGKTFLRFDDVVIGTLSNKLRFNRYYFDGFLELVRLGAVVPAFDGFEEMFVEGHSGEAISALGSLIDSLDSQGTLVVAARKAFFEFNSFRTQARLFDSIGDRSASFSRLKISRWGEAQFLDYGRMRNYTDAPTLYKRFSERLGPDHPLLSRAYLVRRLFDVASNSASLEGLFAELGNRPQDYFFKFIETLVQREASDKWLDKSGDASQPLLTLEEHHELLAAIAREMWQSSVNALRSDTLDVVVDLFAEPKKRGPVFVRQIRERIKNHSLLATEPGRAELVQFDHDEFRRFYLGEALGQALSEKQSADLISMLTVDQLPADTCDQALNHVERAGIPFSACVPFVLSVAQNTSALSFARENCGALLVRLLDGLVAGNEMTIIEEVSFPVDALSTRNLQNVEFRHCYFQPSTLSGSRLRGVQFEDCEIERLELSDAEVDSVKGLSFINSRVKALTVSDQGIEKSYYGPHEIGKALTVRGAIVQDGHPIQLEDSQQPDVRVELVERFLRVFLRSTQVNEDTIRAKFGRLHGTLFVDDVLPALLKAEIVESVKYQGKGVQSRFKLGVQMQTIQDALDNCEGNFDKFISTFGS